MPPVAPLLRPLVSKGSQRIDAKHPAQWKNAMKEINCLKKRQVVS